VLQAIESFQNGFWSARSWEFYQQPVINRLLWLRVLPDSVFILLGVLPIVAAGLWGMAHLRKADSPTGRAAGEAESTADLVSTL
jgi:nitric oxide reductase subunit B